jgi:hypothetical protein
MNVQIPDNFFGIHQFTGHGASSEMISNVINDIIPKFKEIIINYASLLPLMLILTFR